nr:tripartite motif-containing protein 15-like [Taeniopygia guttata]
MEPGENSALGDSSSKLKERDRKITKLAAEIRRLTALLAERDSGLRKLRAELAKCDATIRIFTVELGERHTKIGELTADVEAFTKQLQARDAQIRENEAEIGYLKELLGERDSVIRKMREELEALKDFGEIDKTLEELRTALEQRDREIEQRDREIEQRDREIEQRDREIEQRDREIERRDKQIAEMNAELEESRLRIWWCLEEHRKEEEKVAHITLDPLTSHPRLVLSSDGLSARWRYGGADPPASADRFTASPCVLGSPGFTAGRHTWTVSVAEGPFCAVGVSRDSVPRQNPSASFGPAAGVWAVQRWGNLGRALTEPPTALAVPRVPRRLRVALDYDGGRVAFFDGDRRSPTPLFAFPAAAFAGERVRPWFWLELGEISIVR